ncbi:MAG: acetylxylan esterase [Myxococcota bacterium]|nr:acetylxylan esterase [Myxococcota bacterium]
MDANPGLFRPDPAEPLGLWRGPAAPDPAASDLRVERLEYTSRGDRVPARLLLPPEGDGPFPLVLLQHGANGGKDAPYMAQVGAPWVRKGAALLSIDFPLHGERYSAKLSGLLRGALGLEGRPTDTGRTILGEFVRQSVLDLQRALDAAAALPEVDASRVVYAGLSLGSIVGATYCSIDPRPRAAALALGGGGFGDAVDPCRHVARVAPRPLLFVNATRDETISRAATEALYEAAAEPKQLLWFEAGHQDLPGRAMKEMWLFLERHLES